MLNTEKFQLNQFEFTLERQYLHQIRDMVESLSFYWLLSLGTKLEATTHQEEIDGK